MSIGERKEKDKGNKKDNNKKIKKYNLNYKYKSFLNDYFNTRYWKRKCKKCNIITIIRNIFITIIVLSAIGFYATIFIVG